MSGKVSSEKQFRIRICTDRKILGLNVTQKRDDRIDNALFCTGVLNNIFNMGRS